MSASKTTIENAKRLGRVGLDVDGVEADFAQGFINQAIKMGITSCCFPKDSSKVDKWMFPCSIHFKEVWDAIEHSHNFWLGLPPIPHTQKFFKTRLAFTPELYITKRPVRSWVTRRWLQINGFPDAEVITVNDPKEKNEIVKARCDVYIDDLVSTVRDMRADGINAVLYAAPYQVSEDITGLPIINNMKELYG